MTARETDMRLEFEILRVLSHADGPVGAVKLCLKLKDSCGCSQPTIGRKLASLDWAGLTRKVGRSGRVITDRGKQRFEELAIEIVHSDSNHLTALFNVDSWNTFVEVLELREALETYTTRSAALRATDGQIREMRKVLTYEEHKVLQHLPAAGEDIAFHDLIAEASGNRVAREILMLARRRSELSPLVAAIRRHASGRLVNEHEAILAAIARRDPSLAETAMKAHIAGLIRDVEDFRLSHVAGTQSPPRGVTPAPGTGPRRQDPTK